MSKNKTLVKKKGGILINSEDQEKAFENFLMNSKINFLTRGSSGLTFIAEINSKDYINHPNYIYSSSTKYGEPIKHIILKIGFTRGKTMDSAYLKSKLYEEFTQLMNKYLKTKEEIKNLNFLKYRLTRGLCFICDKVDIVFTKEEDFIREVNNQTEIYIDTINYLQPICPGIIYAKIYKDEEVNRIVDIISNSVDPEDRFTKEFIRLIKLKKENEFFSNLTIIGMELVEKDEKAITLFDIINEYQNSNNKDEIKEQYELYVNMGRFSILNLLLSTDFTHGDFHSSNIMINKNDNTYFKDHIGSPVIIDFGFAEKITDENLLAEIDELFEKKDFIKILRILCSIPRLDGVNLNNPNPKAVRNYGWICGSFDLLEEKNIIPDDEYWNRANKQIDELFQSRIKALNELEEEFKIKHENEPDKYPLLPLNEKIYNKLFKGIYPNNKRRRDELTI